MIRVSTLILAAAALVGCAGEPPKPTASPMAIRTMPAIVTCAGVGLEATVHGDPSDPSVVWLTSMLPGGDRIDAAWTTGNFAVFDPTLRIFDSTGRMVIQEGDYVDGGCVTGPDANGPIFITNPRDSFRLECGTVDPGTCTSTLSAFGLQSGNEPIRRLATFIVRDAAGHYTVLFENGERVDGTVQPNL